MKRAGKERTKGVRVRGVLTCAGEFLPFLCSFLCRRVIAYLLSSSSKKKSTTTHGGKSIFWERIPAFHFLKRDLSTVGGVLYRLKSRVLSFFFGIDLTIRKHVFGLQKHVTTQRLSSIHLRCSAYHDTRLS